MEQPKKSWLDTLEETILGLLLAAMTLVTFYQVAARKITALPQATWILEFTVILFSWLVMLGMSYGVRVSSHLGVDAFIRFLPKKGFKIASIIAAVISLLWALILFDSIWVTYPLSMPDLGGALDYVLRMKRIGIEMENIPWPRWMVYSIMPIGLLLFAYRTIEAIVAISQNRRESLIASHEVEDMMEEVHHGEPLHSPGHEKLHKR